MEAASMAPSAAPAPDQGVQLVDEQDDVAAGADLLQHLLQALLEVAPVAGPGHQGAQVEGVELLARAGLGHVAGHDPLREALDDGRLADARLADEHRVVLGPPGQDLHDPLDLALAADHRVELAFPGQLGEVAAELVEDGAARRDIRQRSGAAPAVRLLWPGGLVARKQLDNLLADPGQVCTQADQHLRGHAFTLADQAEQHVLGPDVVVAELQSLPQGKLQDLLGPWGERRRPGGGRPGRPDRLLHLFTHSFQTDAQRFQRLGCHALTLVDEAEQDVLGPDEVVVQQARFFLGQHQHSSGSVGKAFKQRCQPPQQTQQLRIRPPGPPAPAQPFQRCPAPQASHPYPFSRVPAPTSVPTAFANGQGTNRKTAPVAPLRIPARPAPAT